MGDFKKDLQEGEQCEVDTFYWLGKLCAEKMPESYVQIVSNDKKYQEMDVDIIWRNRRCADGTHRDFLIECKYDRCMCETGNIFYEETTSGNIGCFEKTEAHYIFYEDGWEETVYIIVTNRLRKFVQENKNKLRKVRGGDASIGYTIPISTLWEEKIIVDSFKPIRSQERVKGNEVLNTAMAILCESKKM